MEQQISILKKNFKSYYKELSQINIKLFQQEDYLYEWKEDLYEVLASLKDIDEQIFTEITKMLRKEKKTNCIEFLQAGCDKKYLQQSCFQDELSSPQLFKNLNNKFMYIANSLKNILQTDLNKKNYYYKTGKEQRYGLITKISKEKNLLQFLKFLVELTSLDYQFVQCGSNSLSLLVEMEVDIKNQNFKGIKIKNTSLIGANFFKCNLSKSEFDTVVINGINLNDAQLFNCKWKNENNIYQMGIAGTIIASGSDDNSVRIWDAKTGQLTKAKFNNHTGAVRSVCFSPDGNTLASGSCDFSMYLLDVKTGLKKSKLKAHTNWVQSLCFSPNGKTLASSSNDNSIRLWDLNSAQQKSKLDILNEIAYSICFSPDGAALLHLFLGILSQSKESHSSMAIQKLSCLYVTPANGTLLASGGADKFICLWDIILERQKFKLDGHSQAVLSVCFSPDGMILASGSMDTTVILWDIKTGNQKSNLIGHEESIYSVCFSPNGSTLVSSSVDKSIRLWEIQISKSKSKVSGNMRQSSQVCFSSDGFTLASVNEDNAVILWNVKTGQEKANLVGHNSNVRSVCFSPGRGGYVGP
ncbi:unnamed protein product, partial (macronuclear) [Paramecium tetraurelia]